ncbi:hypothetical protein KR009_006127, partial [Drosophila setifemur]
MFFNRWRGLAPSQGNEAALCEEQGMGAGTKEPVILNVYDLFNINDYTIVLGFGFFHSGIQIYGTEYAYGGHDHSLSGIFEIEPCNDQGELGEQFQLRKSILLGHTRFSSEEVRSIIDQLGLQYPGNGYHLTAKNCNHFANSLAHILCGQRIPGWVNRLAHMATCVPFLER